MWLLPDTIVVEIDDVSSILDLCALLLMCLHAKHEGEGSVRVTEISK